MECLVRLNKDETQVCIGTGRQYRIRQEHRGRNMYYVAKLPVAFDFETQNVVRHTFRGKSCEELLQAIQKSISLSREDMELNEKQYTLDQYYPIWEEENRYRYRTCTRNKHFEQFAKYISSVFGDDLLDEIGFQEVKIWRSLLEESGINENDIHKTVSLLKTILTDAEANREIACCPVIRNKMVSKEKTHLPLLPEQQAYIERNRNKDRYCRMIAIALRTGMRIGEVSGLTFDDIDFRRNIVWVRRQVTIDNTFGKRRVVYKSHTKTGKFRVVKNDKTTIGLLREQMEEQERKMYASAHWNPERFVFTDDLGAVLNPGAVSRKFKNLMKDTGRKVRFHDLRRTYACNEYRNNGRNMDLLCKNLGVTRETLFNYVTENPEGIAFVSENIDAWMDEMKKRKSVITKTDGEKH